MAADQLLQGYLHQDVIGADMKEIAIKILGAALVAICAIAFVAQLPNAIENSQVAHDMRKPFVECDKVD